MPTSAPQSQKADVRPISFVLVDKTGVNPISPKRIVTLYIRPEELTKTDPSRLNVGQTLTGAWGDNFGPGLGSININGHTGWRKSADITEGDGLQRFAALKTNVFDNWHAQRKEAAKAGRDPDLVQLVFADVLDSFTVVVAPLVFTLRRSRSRPLLMNYQISLIVLDQNIDQSEAALKKSTPFDTVDIRPPAFESIARSAKTITERAKTIKNDIDRFVAEPVARFMRDTAALYMSVEGAVRSADEVAGSIITVARLTSQAGLNLFRTAAAIEGIPSLAKARLMQIAGAYSNVFCVLRNAIRQDLFVPDYSPIFGSSNCSSTNGGRPPSPLSAVNPFFLVAPTSSASPIQLTQGSQRAMQMLATTDPVLSPLAMPQLVDVVSRATDGFRFAA